MIIVCYNIGVIQQRQDIHLFFSISSFLVTSTTQIDLFDHHKDIVLTNNKPTTKQKMAGQFLPSYKNNIYLVKISQILKVHCWSLSNFSWLEI